MKFLIAIFLIFFHFSGHTQDHSLAMKGGLNWSNQSSSILKQTKPFQGYSFGLDYRFKLKRDVKIGANLMFNQSGYRVPLLLTDPQGYPLESDPIYVSYQFNYVSIPLKIGYEHGDHFFVFGNFGIATSYLLNAQESSPVFNSDLELIGAETLRITDYFNPLQFALLAEIGAGFNLTDELGAFAEADFQHGITSISKKEYLSKNSILIGFASLKLGLRLYL